MTFRRVVKLARRAIRRADLLRRFEPRRADTWLWRAYDWLRWGPPEE